jgi:Receptor L domain
MVFLLLYFIGNIGAELEENLGMIEEVRNNIKIIGSNAITSLSFLRNLRIIHGATLHYDRLVSFALKFITFCSFKINDI